MNKPELIGVEVMTPDGQGSILSLHPGRVVVHLNGKAVGQEMKGSKRYGELHYAYKYEEVEIIKGRYFFNEEKVAELRKNLRDGKA